VPLSGEIEAGHPGPASAARLCTVMMDLA